MKKEAVEQTFSELKLLARSASELHESRQFPRQCSEMCQRLSLLRDYVAHKKHYIKIDSKIFDLFRYWLAQSSKPYAEEMAKDLRSKQSDLLDMVRPTIYVFGQFGSNSLNAYLYEEAAKLSAKALATAFQIIEPEVERPTRHSILRVVNNTGSLLSATDRRMRLIQSRLRKP